jgi:hypothetical protein
VHSELSQQRALLRPRAANVQSRVSHHEVPTDCPPGGLCGADRQRGNMLLGSESGLECYQDEIVHQGGH